MMTRELNDERTALILQEDHAELAAQFAGHWGNQTFQRLTPYESMMTAAIYHDSHFRDAEVEPPIDMSAGRPHGHRTIPFAPAQLKSLCSNVAWVKSWDPYASLIVSMHHTGLPQNRYDVIRSWQNPTGNAPRRPMRPEVESCVHDLEAKQRETIAALSKERPDIEREI
jgi:hypothetical protein